MEAIKTKGVAKNGLLTISVPHQFDEQELEVIILSNADNDKNFSLLKNEKIQQEKVAKRLSIIGTAKDPDAPIEGYDVYDQ